MKIKSIAPINFAGFCTEQVLLLEEDITVITGRNDTSKSSILRLIEICFNEVEIQEYDANFDNLRTHNNVWNNDFIKCKMEILLQNNLDIYNIQSVGDAGSIVKLHCKLDHTKERIIRGSHNGTHLKMFPLIVNISNLPNIREIIDIRQPTFIESDLLKLMFGDGFSAEKLLAMSAMIYSREIKSAENILNKKIKEILPTSFKMEFVIHNMNDGKIGIHIADPIENNFESLSPLGSRGTGVKKILSLLAKLTTINAGRRNVLIIADEPETSLHPDSQHSLRKLLELLSLNEFYQVIYTTHSPGMINTWMGRTVRLFTKKLVDGKSTVSVNNRPIDDNYSLIRTSLGVNPADSLMFAPITIIVEGITEAICLPIILKKLEMEEVEGFEKVSGMLSQTHLMDGNGDSFEKMCRLCVTQGVNPIVLLDGDKNVQKLKEEFPELKIVEFPNGKEIENVIPESIYIEAISKISGNREIIHEKYEEWKNKKDAKYIERTMFSKIVSRFIYEEFPDAESSKDRILKEALVLCDVKDIQTDTFLALLKVIEGQLLRI